MHLARREPQGLKTVEIAGSNRILHIGELALVVLCAHVQNLG